VEANPNPVRLVGQTQGTTTVEWNTGLGTTAEQASLVVRLGSQTVSSTPVASQGTQQVSVQTGNTYTMELVLLERGRRKVLASIQVPVKAGIQIGGGGNVGRIKNLRVIPRGTWVELKFGTPFPGKAAVWISTNPPQGNSEQGLQVVRYAPAVGSPGFSHTKKLYGIEPGTKYYFLIRASSQGGLAANTSGDFETKRREVTVRVSKIKVIDDSDDLTAGDLSFGFYLNPTYNASLGDAWDFHPATGAPPLSADSGDFVNTPGVELDLSDVGESVEFNVTGFDSDSSGCGRGLMLPRRGSSTNSCGDMSSRTETYALTPKAPGQETFTDSFQLNVGYGPGGKLKFRVYGTVAVRYVD
jgi:hypothetical protein